MTWWFDFFDSSLFPSMLRYVGSNVSCFLTLWLFKVSSYSSFSFLNKQKGNILETQKDPQAQGVIKKSQEYTVTNSKK